MRDLVPGRDNVYLRWKASIYCVHDFRMCRSRGARGVPLYWLSVHKPLELSLCLVRAKQASPAYCISATIGARLAKSNPLFHGVSSKLDIPLRGLP